MQIASRDGLIDDLYHANHAAVLRVCSSILRNPDDAADAAQEVFLIALESLLDGRGTARAPRAWLLTVARNYCLGLLRRRKTLGKALVALGPDAGHETDVENAVADRDFVDIVFKQLTTRERQALWQSAVESRSLADIAGRLRLSYMAAAQVLHRARRHALQVAARVAVVFGGFQLVRQRPAGGQLLAASRLAAVAAVPLLFVSLQSSGPTQQPAALPPAAVAGARPGSAAGGLQTLLPDTPAQRGKEIAGSLNSPLPGSAPSLTAALNAVRRQLRSLPSPPAGVGTTLVLPSVAALPSPPVLPGLP